MMGGKIIKDTKTQPDKNGVYRAKVVINGKEKRLPSSFFPENWDRTDVLKAIHEAYEWLLKRQFYPSLDRKSTRLNSSHVAISYAVFCLKKKKKKKLNT